MTTMRVGIYERAWMWAAGVLIVLFLAMLGYAAVAQGLRPPSHIETIDPRAVFDDPRFANPGVTAGPDGRVIVTSLAMTFAFQPAEIRVPANRPVSFGLTSSDVQHGFQIVGTNANTMVIPGYVSEFTTVFKRAGEYLIVCNEYCGVGHHLMSSKLIVEAAP
ncbi:MAG: cytochrome c oxidase subunit II [Gemmatimonadetes bacterium]|nr:cytochrome c oxidase subunit II [Gemmatimonadota bacterium]